MMLKLTQQEEEQQWRQSEGCGEAGPAKHLKIESRGTEIHFSNKYIFKIIYMYNIHVEKPHRKKIHII